MYVKLMEKSPFDMIKKKSMLSEDVINSKIDELIKNQFVNEDRITLTEIWTRFIMRSTSRRSI